MTRLALALAAALAALLGTILAETGIGRWADGLTSDAVRAARALVLGPQEAEGDGRSPVVVVAIDEETYRRPPFEGVPRALWSPQLARLVQALLNAGTAVIGLDIVLATTVDTVLANYDLPLRQALSAAAGEGRVVLAEVQSREQPLGPHPFYLYAVNGEDDVRAANLQIDPDGIVRRVPLVLADGTPTLAPELVARFAAQAGPSAIGGTLAAPPAPGNAGRQAAGGGSLILDLPAAMEAAPTFSMADVLACVEAGRGSALEAAFKGKIVLVGGDLVGEDRHFAANHLALRASPTLPDARQRCLPPPPGLIVPTVTAGTMAGVQLHAGAVRQLLEGRVPGEPGPATRRVLTALWAAATVTPLALWGAVPLAIGLALAGLLGAPLAAGLALPDLVLPAGRMLLATLFATATALAAREALVGRALRRLRKSFALYLPRAEVDRLLSAGEPRLGGDAREVSVLFVDIAGYSQIAVAAEPESLVRLLNAHFARLGAVITGHGGVVLQYLGDGLLAVFGAPLPDPQHAIRAVEAGIACLAAVDAAGGAASAPPFPRTSGGTATAGGAPADPPLPTNGSLRIRIGIASGPVLVGNIGSPDRFNYAVVGDVVNLAARVEGLNKAYGTRLLVAESTAREASRSREQQGCARPFGCGLREIDRVEVVGREGALGVFGPGTNNDEHDALFARASNAYYARDFATAAALWSELAASDPAADTLATRARAYALSPPGPSWDGVFRPREK